MGGMNEVYRECLKCPLTFQTSLTYLISPKWGGKASPLILSLYLVRTFSVTKYFCFILPASSLPLQWTDREHNMEYGLQKIVLSVQLVEPGTVYVIQNFLIQIFHKLCIICCVFLIICYMEQNGRGVDCFCKSPVHSVMDYRFAVPVCCVTNSRCTVCIPCVSNCAVIQILCSFNIRCCASLYM